MDVECGPAKRAWVLAERELDMAETGAVFEGAHLTFPDDRMDYGEDRSVIFGFFEGRMVAVAWTPRGEARRIISMRKCNARERRNYASLLGLRDGR